jgi:hypothetical protein
MSIIIILKNEWSTVTKKIKDDTNLRRESFLFLNVHRLSSEKNK